MPSLSELIQRYGIRRDAWSPDYESALQLEDQGPVQQVDLTLERARHHWEPLRPQIAAQHALQALEPLVFVDGVRRMQMRLCFEYAGQYLYSGLGTAVVGALQIQPGQALAMSEALVLEPEVRRYALLGALPELQAEMGEPLQATQITGIPHPFQPVWLREVKEPLSPQAPLQALQTAMRERERELLQRLRTQLQHGTVLVDGPLQKFSGETGVPVVGYVKTLHTQYLPPEQQAILPRLQAAERTPIFRIGQRQLSWYQRLAPLAPIDHPLTGIVRLEVLSSSPLEHLEQLISLANRLTVSLPLLVLERFQDARSPQNLLPIHALEQELKNRIGDETLIQRRLEAYLQGLWQQPNPPYEVLKS